jgi:4-hydroxybenzoate polyprenyltransferase
LARENFNISGNVVGEKSLLSPQRTRKSVFLALLRLMRPANIITAYADILAGYAAAGATDRLNLVLLLIATTGLYGGGVVLNDVFDAKLDTVERPERPIPSGVVRAAPAGIFGGFLLACGILAAWLCSPLSGAVALATAASALIYDSVGKHDPFFGPLNMGLCRGLNLLLGLTAVAEAPLMHWPVALITLCYIAGITSLSRGEVRGGTRTAASLSAGWLAGSLIALAMVVSSEGRKVEFALPFFALLLYRIAGPFWRAFRTLNALEIRAAIKAGILSLIVLDASIAAIFAGPWYGAAVLLLYVPAMLLAKLFAVT